MIYNVAPMILNGLYTLSYPNKKFDMKELKRGAGNAFVVIQELMRDGQWDKLADLCTPKMLLHLKKIQKEREQASMSIEIKNIQNIDLVNTDPDGLSWVLGKETKVFLAIHFHCLQQERRFSIVDNQYKEGEANFVRVSPSIQSVFWLLFQLCPIECLPHLFVYILLMVIFAGEPHVAICWNCSITEPE